MNRNITLFILAAAAACLVFTQIGCADTSSASSNNGAPVEKKIGDGKNKKLAPGYLDPK